MGGELTQWRYRTSSINYSRKERDKTVISERANIMTIEVLLMVVTEGRKEKTKQSHKRSDFIAHVEMINIRRD